MKRKKVLIVFLLAFITASIMFAFRFYKIKQREKKEMGILINYALFRADRIFINNDMLTYYTLTYDSEITILEKHNMKLDEVDDYVKSLDGDVTLVCETKNRSTKKNLLAIKKQIENDFKNKKLYISKNCKALLNDVEND